MLLSDCRSLSDAELVAGVLGGDAGLYEMLMRRYNQRLFRVVRSVVLDDAEAEDVLQEAWVRAYEHLAEFAGRSSFATWVGRIAFYEALARVRKAKRWTPIENAQGGIVSEAERRQPAETPESQVIRAELGRILESAVDALPDSYRSVFVLREIEQMSTAETAECLDVSEEAVKTRLHRSRAMLRRELAARLGPALSETYPFMAARCDRAVTAVLARIRAR